MKNLFLVFLAVISTACGSSSVYNLSEDEQKGITYLFYNHSYERVFDACLAEVQSGEAVIDLADSQAGIINTRWVQNEETARDTTLANQRSRFSLSIDSVSSMETKVLMRLFLQERDAYGNWNQIPITPQIAEEKIIPLLQSVEQKLEKAQ